MLPSTVNTYPVWPRVVAAFVAGMLFSAFCVTQITPRDRLATNSVAAGPGESAAAGDAETFVNEAGEVVSADDVTVNEQGQLVDKSGKLVQKTSGGASGGSALAAGTTGAAGKAGTAGTAAKAGTKAGSSKAGSTVAGGTAGAGASGSGTGTGGGAIECKAGKNGGATDKGVSATEIKIAATVVRDGPGASLLKPSEDGMVAVINKVNNGGGICGRRLKLTAVNDSWDGPRGKEYIRKFIEEGQFALPVVPSSEGLSDAINSNLIEDSGIPVVGANGLRIDQYGPKAGNVFPVATATVSIMRAMAKYAYEAKGARTFGIVWDSKYKFGREGADAFKEYVRSLPGASIKADQPLNPENESFLSESQQFNKDCDNTSSSSGCDVVVLLLVPATAKTWSQGNSGSFAGRGKLTYGAQTLFTDSFARDCAAWCNGMNVWTGFNPAIPPLDSKPGVGTYINDVKAVNSSIDYRNQFVEGAYLGMQVFVEAVKKCSPNLTRACVKAKLDTPEMDFTTDLTSLLRWRPGAHHANKAAQAFSINAAGGSFNGWTYQNSGFVTDPKL